MEEMENYRVESGRTENTPDKVKLTPMQMWELRQVFLRLRKIGAAADNLKKAIFYGKEVENVLVTNPKYCKETSQEISKPEISFLHGVLGLVSETSEIVEQLDEYVLGHADMDRVEVGGEIGDQLWYLSLLLRELDFTYETVSKANINKLKNRFPEAFDAERAITPDKESERRQLELDLLGEEDGEE